jgi:regulator of replication initiation timing
MTVKSGRVIDVEPLERLEGKLRRLVALVEQLRAEKTALVDDNSRLQIQVDSLQARVAEAEAQAGAELVALREERDQVRTRGASLLDQVEKTLGPGLEP